MFVKKAIAAGLVLLIFWIGGEDRVLEMFFWFVLQVILFLEGEK